MEKYKATNKNSTAEVSQDEEQPKSQDEKNIENNANTIRNAAKVAKATNIPQAAAIGHAVEGLDKLSGGKSTEFLGKTMNDANKIAPGGKQVQDLSNKLSESGVGDKIGKVADMKSSGGGAGAGKGVGASKATASGAPSSSSSKTLSSNSKSGSGFGSDSGMLTSNLIASPGMKLYLIGGVFFLFVIIVFLFTAAGYKDQQNLATTNHTVFSESSVGAIPCTPMEVEEKVIYVGSNLIKDIYVAVPGAKSEFISNTSGYGSFKSNIFPLLEKKFSSLSNGVVILSFDIYDLANFDLYLSDYKDLIARYPKINFYVISFGPVDESLNSYGITNSMVVDYNIKISSEFNDIYLDIYSYLAGGFSTIDGISYSVDTNKNLHNYILNMLSNSGKLLCSGGSIETITDVQLRGGSATVLANGDTVLSKVDESLLEEWNRNLINDVNRAGVGNGLAPAIAAYDLIQGALIKGFIIPYYWGGGREIVSGIDETWGELKSITLSGNKYQSVNSIHPYGLDGLGLVNWAIKNGGCTSFTFKSSSELISLGDKINIFDTTPGDIMVKGDEVVMILRNTGSEIIVAEANRNYGVVFNKYYYSNFETYNIVRMSSYYKNNCM